LTENLIEAELFGHEKGAFTGAEGKREGRFKAADGGVIFLDEIAELSPAAQVKLLRVLQEGTFEPIGTNSPIKVDVRVLSATHRNLTERVRQGLFREDLLYRINVIEIPLPPLRQRPGDLSVLVRHFLLRFLPEGASLPELPAAVWAALSAHTFPGNVRELSHAIQRAVVMSAGRPIGLEDLPPSISGYSGEIIGVPAPQPDRSLPLDEAMRAFECNYVTHVVEQANRKRVRAAKMLGISRKSLWEKMKRHGIETPLSGERNSPDEPGEDEDQAAAE
jgi:DNA-binding NtrC family response regulator